MIADDTECARKAVLALGRLDSTFVRASRDPLLPFVIADRCSISRPKETFQNSISMTKRTKLEESTGSFGPGNGSRTWLSALLMSSMVVIMKLRQLNGNIILVNGA